MSYQQVIKCPVLQGLSQQKGPETRSFLLFIWSYYSCLLIPVPPSHVY